MVNGYVNLPEELVREIFTAIAAGASEVEILGIENSILSAVKSNKMVVAEIHYDNTYAKVVFSSSFFDNGSEELATLIGDLNAHSPIYLVRIIIIASSMGSTVARLIPYDRPA